MSTLLDEYLERLSSLPADVRKTFAIIGEMDRRVEDMKVELERSTKSYLVRSQPDTSTSRTPSRAAKSIHPGDLAKIRETYAKALEVSEEKIKLAQQCYDALDNHIQQLDADLAKMDLDPATPKRKQPSAASTPTNKRMKLMNGSGMLLPSEPTYCYCNRVSYGEMVACDGDMCPKEWFHFKCVGLHEKPKGKWYCRDCALLQ